jgi:glyoxylase-like metal-dependent hydrolase (beta-lactamase superfamily II)
VHSAERALAVEGKKDREGSIVPYLRHGAAWKLFGVMAAGGIPKNIEEVQTFEDGEVLDVPGRPRVIHGPGHTHGCVAFHFERHGALFVGDVLFGFGVLTGEEGCQVGHKAFNASSQQALDSLSALEGVDADVVLFGHGDPWTQGPAAAVAAARERGIV